jgi:hypothetical protein
MSDRFHELLRDGKIGERLKANLVPFRPTCSQKPYESVA